MISKRLKIILVLTFSTLHFSNFERFSCLPCRRSLCQRCRFLSSGIVMEVVAVWREAGSDIVVEGKALHAVDGDPSVRSKRNFTVIFHRISDIADVCINSTPKLILSRYLCLRMRWSCHDRDFWKRINVESESVQSQSLQLLLPSAASMATWSFACKRWKRQRMVLT